jgi:hypothetical protein
MAAPPRPILHTRLAMVILGEDIGQPEGGQPAITQALMMPVVPHVTIHDTWQSQALHHANEHRNVVYPFVS